MKHTEGNWHAHDGQIYPEQTGKTLALIPYYYMDNKEQQANANLIAAAPDMLEALQNLENDNNQIPAHAWRMIQDAIQKAIDQ